MFEKNVLKFIIDWEHIKIIDVTFSCCFPSFINVWWSLFLQSLWVSTWATLVSHLLHSTGGPHSWRVSSQCREPLCLVGIWGTLKHFYLRDAVLARYLCQCQTPFTRCNQTTGCPLVVSCIQTFYQLSNRLYDFNLFDSCNPRSSCLRSVNIQPVVQPVWQPVQQPAASCKQSFNRLNNRFDNWLYRVNGVSVSIVNVYSSWSQSL